MLKKKTKMFHIKYFGGETDRDNYTSGRGHLSHVVLGMGELGVESL